MSDLLYEINKKIEQIKESQDTINSMNEVHLKIINDRINEIIDQLKHEALQIQSQDTYGSTLYELPDHLRITMKELIKKGEGSAETISSSSGRSRSLESAYLNTLNTMGFVKKTRKGQNVIYQVEYDRLSTSTK